MKTWMVVALLAVSSVGCVAAVGADGDTSTTSAPPFSTPIANQRGVVGVVPTPAVKAPPRTRTVCDHEHPSTWCLGIDTGERCIQDGASTGGDDWVCGCFQDSDCLSGSCSYDFDLGQYACR